MPGTSASVFRTLGDLEGAASRRFPPEIWDYIAGGAGAERTLRANHAAFRNRTILPRALVDVREIRLGTTLLGAPVRLPVFIAPTAYQGAVHPQGEAGTAQGAAERGVLAVFSTLSTVPLEEIARSAPGGTRWFQLYVQPEPAVTRRLVERAERAGYRAIMLTVDAPLLAIRDRQARTGFALDAPVPLGNGAEVLSPSRSPQEDGESYRIRADAGTTWEILDELRTFTRLPLVVKGVLTPDDARRAVDHGAQGIVVSNHGGRQLDGAPASLDVLPAIVGEVGTEAEVYLDGGVRRGSDILLALSLGAKAVGIGRPVLWALGLDGAAGVSRLFELLGLELATVMALAGRRSAAELGPENVGTTRYESRD
jgi:4-hydroxymandelate oxidase